MDSALTARRVLARAAVLAGGVSALAERLEIAQGRLGDLLTGAAPVPDELFLAAIDIVLEELPDAVAAKRAAEREALRPSPKS